MGQFDDLVPEKPQGTFGDLIPGKVSDESMQELTEEVMEGFGEEGLGPVGAEQDFDVDDLIDAGIISPENIKGRTLGEISKDPEIQREAAIIGGLMIGSAVAPEVTAPIALSRYPRIFNAISKMIGAGVGAGTGSLVSEVRDPTEDPLKTAGVTAAAGALGEGAGRALIGAGEKVLAPFKEKLVEGAKNAVDAITKRGGIVTPGKASESRIIDTAEGISEASILGGGRIKGAADEAVDIARNIADDFVEGFSRQATREDTSLLVQDAIQDGALAFKEAGGKLYAKVDSLAAGATVNISKVKETARGILAQSEKGLGSPDVRRIVKSIEGKGDVVSFSDAQALRSDLLGVSRLKEKGLVAGKGESAAKRLANKVNGSMNVAARDLTPDALNAWRNANRFWKSGSKVFGDRVIKSLAIRSPDGLFESAFKHNNPATIRKIKGVVSNKEAWTEIRGQFVRDAFEKSSNELGELSGKRLLKYLKKWENGGSLKEVLSVEQAKNIKQIARTLQIVESSASNEKIGSIAIQLLQVGAAGALFEYNERSASGGAQAAAIIFGPAVMARALTNKSFSKWLTIGFKAPAGSKQATMAASRVSAILLNEGATRKEREFGDMNAL